MAHGTQADLPVIANLREFDDQSGTFLEKLVFNNRSVVLVLCALVTLVLGFWSGLASREDLGEAAFTLFVICVLSVVCVGALRAYLSELL